MKYCQNCGGQLDDKAAICIHCGTLVEAPKPQNTVAADDAPSTGLAFAGFFVPIVGFILYAINSSTSPKKAKSALKGAIAGTVVGFVFTFIFYFFYFMMMFSY